MPEAGGRRLQRLLLVKTARLQLLPTSPWSTPGLATLPVLVLPPFPWWTLWEGWVSHHWLWLSCHQPHWPRRSCDCLAVPHWPAGTATSRACWI